MKNLLIYYFQIILPLPLLIWAAINGTSRMFVLLLALYFIYRYYVDGYKLYRAGIISNKERMYPFLSIRYFKQLYFE